jgi:exosortase/archaeosortase family protein
MGWLQKYKTEKPITVFLVKFIVLFCLFYGINYGFIGLTIPGGLYWPWLDHHLNYVVAFRSFLLHSASAIIGLFGYRSIVAGYYLFVFNGATLRMVYSCIGLGILSFWWAFVLSFPQSRAAKIRYFLLGTVLIIAMNIIRISALAILYTKYSGKQYRNIDHHLIFEICVYGVLFFMMYRWINTPFVEAGKAKDK